MAALEEEKVKSSPTELSRGERLAAQKAAKAARKAADRGKTPMAVNRLAEMSSQMSDWVIERKKPLLGLLACAVILIADIIAWQVYAKKSDREAGALLVKAVATAQAMILTEENALEQESVDETYASTEERAKQSLQGYQKISSKYANTTAGHFGTIGEANAQYELGKFDKAQKAYNKAFEIAGDNNFVKLRALEGIGFSLEAMKKYDKAGEAFKRIASIAEGAYKPESDYHVARMQLIQGKRDEAIKELTELFKVLKKREGDGAMDHNFIRGEVETRLRELGIDPDEIKVQSDKKEKEQSKNKDKSK